VSLLVIVGVAVAVAMVIGIGLALRSRSTARAATPSQIEPGNEVGLKRGPNEEPTIYRVTAKAHFVEPGEDDEHWTELELERAMDGRVFYLEYDRDDEDRWVWALSRKLKASDIDMELSFTDLGMGKKQKPPAEIQWGGNLWEVINDCHHYKVNVTDWRVDRPEKRSYKTRVTDYRQMGGEQELSLEVWEGGYGLTVKESAISEVTLIKG